MMSQLTAADLGLTVIGHVAPMMDVYREEIFGPVLSVMRAKILRDSIDLIDANAFGNGTAIFTSSGEAARQFQCGVKLEMIGINVPVPVAMAYYSFGGLEGLALRRQAIHGREGVSFYSARRSDRYGRGGRDVSLHNSELMGGL